MRNIPVNGHDFIRVSSKDNSRQHNGDRNADGVTSLRHSYDAPEALGTSVQHNGNINGNINGNP